MSKEKNLKLKTGKSAKPKYNMWQNSWFMIKLAWISKEKKVVVFGVLSAVLAVALNLVNLYVSPTLLSAVEIHVSAGELFLTIAGFVLGLMLISAASSYVNTNALFGRISIRIEIMLLLHRKATITSYPNVDDDKFIKLLAKARESTFSSAESTEAIWTTLTALTTNIVGFLIYTSLLTTVQPLLILLILVTTLISYFIGNRVNGYGYRHREEEAEYERQMNYLVMCAEDLSAAKDIRIFGLRSWLEELYGKAMSGYTAFHKKVEGVYIWSPIIDLVLTFLRNAVAYAYLISLVIQGGLGAAEFLLYFAAVGGFTEWVSGILSGFSTLYKQSLDLSTVRESLEYHEPFQLDGGEHIETEPERKYEIYNQDNRENTFGSKGLMAKYGRGPMGLYHAASSAVSVIFTGVVYAFVCLKAWAGAFGLGAVAQYIASITKVSGGVSSLVSALGNLRNNAEFLVPIFEFLDIPNNMYQGSLTVEKRRDRKYEVEFRNISFKYPGSENYALRNVSMKFEIGRRLAFVGMNGSGKTTFIKLLCRLYDPTEGEILLNGIDIRKYNYAEYMTIFSVVFQDFRLFALKLGENVASKTAYDDRLVTDSLKKAGFAEKLLELRDGVETYLYKDYDKDGVNFSGGEAQKIAIARALYKDAPFIILDEPTAALDPVAEAEIYSKFNEIAGDKTAIYISHRLSSCIFCDEIVVFHEGAIIQQGAHASLVADQDGKYYELWHAQAQYYTE